MKIVYPLWVPFANELFYLIAEEGKRRGMEFEFATESKVVEKYMKERDIPVFNTKKYVDKILKTENLLKEYELIEKEYNVTANDLTFSDSVLSKKPLEYKKKISAAYIKTWKNFFEKSKPELVIATDGSETFGITYATVAKELGLNVIFTNGGCLFPGAMFWDSRILLADWVDQSHLERELTEAERKKVLEYVNLAKEKKPMIGVIPKKLLSMQRIKEAIDYWWTCIIKEKGGMVYHSPIRSLKWGVMLLLREKLNKKFYSEPNFNEKYIFSPLHVPYDSQITLRAPHFVEQYKPIEMCSKYIPEGYMLYVKEHPHAKGSIPLKWLERITSLPNVKLVPPDVNPHDLIMNAQCMITINSDVGWEALIHGKPVVVLAKPFYSGFGITFDVNCFKYSGVSKVEFDTTCEERFPKKIEEALRGKIDAEKVYKLINATMNSVYPCSFYRSDAFNEYNCNEDNIRKIVDSMIDYACKINKRLESKGG
jgi:hypothetical protein